MTSSEIYSSLIDLLKNKFEVSVENITPSSTLSELGLDSLSLMEFVFAAEDAFSIRIAEEDLDPRQIGTTLSDISNIIERMVAKNLPSSK
jgi:acyl carrier protein